MLTRRSFTSLIAAAIAAPALDICALAQSPVQSPAAPSFSVMIWTLTNNNTFEQALDICAQAGFHQVELVGEFKKWSDADYTRILARMKTLGIAIDSVAGTSKGFADPNGDAFIDDLKSLIPIVNRLGSKQIIFVSGKRLDVPQAVQHQACIDNLKRAVPLLEAAGMNGVIEPIDRLEQPQIYLDGVNEGFEICRAVGSPNMRVLYDLYHEQRSQGNIIEKLEKNIEWVGLIHIADVPGRHEPGTGEMNYDNIYRTLARLKYKGPIAMEFYGTGDIVKNLRAAREQVLRDYQ
jgi:hydroxypyruvate isomerase